MRAAPALQGHIGAGHDLCPGVGLHLKINRKSFAHEGSTFGSEWCWAEYEKPQKATRIVVKISGRIMLHA
jgi:hypothetical protein